MAKVIQQEIEMSAMKKQMEHLLKKIAAKDKSAVEHGEMVNDNGDEISTLCDLDAGKKSSCRSKLSIDEFKKSEENKNKRKGNPILKEAKINGYHFTSGKDQRVMVKVRKQNKKQSLVPNNDEIGVGYSDGEEDEAEWEKETQRKKTICMKHPENNVEEKGGCKHCNLDEMKSMDRTTLNSYLNGTTDDYMVGKVCIDCKKETEDMASTFVITGLPVVYYCESGFFASGLTDEDRAKEKEKTCDYIKCNACYNIELDDKLRGGRAKRTRMTKEVDRN